LAVLVAETEDLVTGLVNGKAAAHVARANGPRVAAATAIDDIDDLERATRRGDRGMDADRDVSTRAVVLAVADRDRESVAQTLVDTADVSLSEFLDLPERKRR